MKTLCIFALAGFSALYAQNKKTPDKKKEVLEISYTNSNNMTSETMDKSFENSSGLSEEDIREIKATFLNASNKYLLFVDVKNFNSVYEKDVSFVPKENHIDDSLDDYTVFNTPFIYNNNDVFSGQLECGNTQRFSIKNTPYLKWTITKETKKIGDWTCTKAIAENDFMPTQAEVWFTEDVPFQNGPAHYFGLPGLVVEVVVPDIFRITFSGMKHSEMSAKDLERKIKTYTDKLAKEKASSLEEMKDYFKKAFKK